MNKAILIGRAGKDPEVRRLEGGTSVARFSLATSKKFTNKNGEKIESTQWHNLVFWGKLAEICEKYVHKGSLLSVTGEISYRDYEDKDGNKKYITEITCDEMEMLGKKDESDETMERAERAAAPKKEPLPIPDNSGLPEPDGFGEENQVPEGDDLPF